ncbi:MAG: hypothetical protein A3I68_02315 [Candidatus Melainabacteria bacterium RIFCSPLOWO2_02_FULL_35_15]|nr:MAG: hypothetical protein A3F80_08835 [Candidatus Melainabacteria bacterium RIFCSPLOWO2_12_FULL_35_11]OGI13241.1 MAG: hypothetical protein A3I68_02315 [Candidatus Melainabacteria bacterium RIFCSPLOWO2_02_FULL_35_15]
MISPILLSAIKRITNNNAVRVEDRRTLANHFAQQALIEDGEPAKERFLLFLDNREVTGPVLAQLASKREIAELKRTFAPFKNLVKDYVRFFSELQTKQFHLQLPTDAFSDPATAAKKLVNVYKELLALLNLDTPRNKQEAQKLIEDINRGIFDGQFNDNLDNFKAWAEKHKVSIKFD